MTKAHRLKIRKLTSTTRTAGSSPQSRGAREREAMAKQQHKGLGLGLPINFLLGCNDGELGNYELARLADVADLRAQMQVLLDQIVDQMSLAWLANWFRAMDRNALKSAIENEENPIEWAKRMIAEGQRSEEENAEVPRAPLPPGVAHMAAALRYQQRNIAEGKCAVCPQPQDPNSVRFCTKHLAIGRARKSQKKAVNSDPGGREYLYAGELPESTHGRQPGTLAALAMGREKRTRALLADVGIAPENAAVSLNAAKEAILKCLADSAGGMTQGELLTKTLIPSKTNLQIALKELVAEEKIGRTGRGAPRDLYRYSLAVGQ